MLASGERVGSEKRLPPEHNLWLIPESPSGFQIRERVTPPPVACADLPTFGSRSHLARFSDQMPGILRDHLFSPEIIQSVDAQIARIMQRSDFNARREEYQSDLMSNHTEAYQIMVGERLVNHATTHPEDQMRVGLLLYTIFSDQDREADRLAISPLVRMRIMDYLFSQLLCLSKEVATSMVNAVSIAYDEMDSALSEADFNAYTELLVSNIDEFMHEDTPLFNKPAVREHAQMVIDGSFSLITYKISNNSSVDSRVREVARDIHGQIGIEPPAVFVKPGLQVLVVTEDDQNTPRAPVDSDSCFGCSCNVLDGQPNVSLQGLARLLDM